MFDDLVETLGCILGLAILLSIALWGTVFVNSRLHQDDDRLRSEKEQLIERQKAQTSAERVWRLNLEPEIVLSRRLRASAANAECWGPHLTDVRTAIHRKDWAGLVHAARLDHPTDAVRREGFDDLQFENEVTGMLTYLQNQLTFEGLRTYVGLRANALPPSSVRFLAVDSPNESISLGSWNKFVKIEEPIDPQDRNEDKGCAAYRANCRYAAGTRAVIILRCDNASDKQRLSDRLQTIQQQFESEVQRINAAGRTSDNYLDFDEEVYLQMVNKYFPLVRALADDF